MTSVEQISGTGNGLQNLIISPSNNPSSNTYSFNGSNIVQFQIPNAPVLLDPETVRITGSLRFTDNEAMTQGSSGEWKIIFIDHYLGVNSCFRSVEWSSTGGNRQSLEKIQNYGQLLQCILPALNSPANYQSDLQIGNLSTQNTEYSSEFIIQNASYYLGVDASGSGVANGLRFCTPIYTGLTLASGQKLPLNALNGLTLTLELGADSSVFFSTETNANPDKLSRIKYELFDLKLECSVYSPTADEKMALMQNPKGVLQCNTFTSLFSVIQASQTNAQFNLGIRELIAVLFKFTPTSSINNLALNEWQSTRIISTSNETQAFTKVRIMRSGVQFPIMSPIDVVLDSEECEFNKLYLQALKNCNERSDPKLATNNFTNDVRFAIGASDYKYELDNKIKRYNKLNSIYGVPYDFLKSFTGANFNGRPLTLNLECPLSDARTNAMYCYVLAKTQIFFDENGVSVVN